MNTLTILTSWQRLAAIKAGAQTVDEHEASAYWTSRFYTADGGRRTYERLRFVAGDHPDAPRLTTTCRGVRQRGTTYRILIGKVLAEENTTSTAPTVVYRVDPQGTCRAEPVTTHGTDALARLRALNRLFSTPADIEREVLALKEACRQQYGPSATAAEINDRAAGRIISLYAYSAAVVGGATALSGALPGPGTVLALGGAFVDMELCTGLQARMIRALALVYGHPYGSESHKKLRRLLSELCLRHHARKEQAARLRTGVAVQLTRQYLKGPILHTVTDVCKHIGIPFSKRAFQRVVPFGVGAVTGFQANHLATRWIGNNAKAFFASCGS